MEAILSELVKYVIKYVLFLILAVAGFIAGSKIRKKKDMQLAQETESAEEAQN